MPSKEIVEKMGRWVYALKLIREEHNHQEAQYRIERAWATPQEPLIPFNVYLPED